MRLKFHLFLTMFFGVACCVPAFAQSQLPEKKKAVLAFDIRLDKLRQNKLVESLKLDEGVGPVQVNPSNFPIEKITRIFGAVSAPESVEEAQKIGQGGGEDLPINFFVRVQFADEATAKAAFDEMSQKGQEVEHNGKTYLKPPEGEEDAPPNMLAHLADAKTLEVGTEAYILLPNRKVFTPPLTQVWGKMNDDAIRVAIDLESARELVDQAMAMAKEGAPKEANMYLGLVDDIAGLQLSIDLDSKNLLTLVATGRDADSTTHLKGGLDALLGLAQGFGKQGIQAIEDKEMADVASAILGSLKSAQQGNDVTVAIPKPTGFEAAVTKAVEQARAAFGGFGQAPPFEPDPSEK